MDGGVDGGGGSGGGDFEVDDFVLEPGVWMYVVSGGTVGVFVVGGGAETPFAKPVHAFFEVAAGFVFRVGYRLDGDVGKGAADGGAEVFWKGIEGIISTLGVIE